MFIVLRNRFELFVTKRAVEGSKSIGNFVLHGCLARYCVLFLVRYDDQRCSGGKGKVVPHALCAVLPFPWFAARSPARGVGKLSPQSFGHLDLFYQARSNLA